MTNMTLQVVHTVIMRFHNHFTLVRVYNWATAPWKKTSLSDRFVLNFFWYLTSQCQCGVGVRCEICLCQHFCEGPHLTWWFHHYNPHTPSWPGRLVILGHCVACLSTFRRTDAAIPQIIASGVNSGSDSPEALDPAVPLAVHRLWHVAAQSRLQICCLKPEPQLFPSPTWMTHQYCFWESSKSRFRSILVHVWKKDWLCRGDHGWLIPWCAKGLIVSHSFGAHLLGAHCSTLAVVHNWQLKP